MFFLLLGIHLDGLYCDPTKWVLFVVIHLACESATGGEARTEGCNPPLKCTRRGELFYDLLYTGRLSALLSKVGGFIRERKV